MLKIISLLLTILFLSACQLPINQNLNSNYESTNSVTDKVVTTKSSTTSNTTQKLLPPPNNQIYFSAFPDFGGPEDQVTTKKNQNFEALAKHKLTWAYFSNNWFDGIKYPKNAVHEINKNQNIPFVRLMPRSDVEQYKKEENYNLENIIAGDFDQELEQWAQDAIEDNIPLLMDFAVEANGDWFPWSGVLNGAGETGDYGDPDYPDGPEKYRDAYRHFQPRRSHPFDLVFSPGHLLSTRRRMESAPILLPRRRLHRLDRNQPLRPSKHR